MGIYPLSDNLSTSPFPIHTYSADYLRVAAKGIQEYTCIPVTIAISLAHYN